MVIPPLIGNPDNGYINPTCISLKATHQFPWTKISFPRSQAKLHLWYPRACVAEISLAKCTNPCGKKRFGSSHQNRRIKKGLISSRTWRVTQIYIRIGRSIQHHLPNSVPKHPCWCRWNQHGAFVICHRMSASVRHLPKGPPCMRAATSDVRLQWSTTVVANQFVFSFGK